MEEKYQSRESSDEEQEVRSASTHRRIQEILSSDSDESSNESDEEEFKWLSNVEVPSAYLCPITHEIMRKPVVASDGYTYEKQAIEKWLDTHDTSPMTRQAMTAEDLHPNRTLCDMIQQFIEKTEKEVTPDHKAVMTKLSRDLQVNYHDVYTGTVVEQTMVAAASIYASQQKAMFRRANDGTTFFEFNIFEITELFSLVNFYNAQFDTLIKSEPVEQHPNIYRIYMDSYRLYNEVSPFLGAYYDRNVRRVYMTLAQALRVDIETIKKGETLATALVRTARLSDPQAQTGCMLQEDFSMSVSVQFNNNHTRAEFFEYYKVTYPGLIIRVHEIANRQFSLALNTNKLMSDFLEAARVPEPEPVRRCLMM